MQYAGQEHQLKFHHHTGKKTATSLVTPKIRTNLLQVLNYKLSQKLILLRNDEFKHLTIILTLPLMWA